MSGKSRRTIIYGRNNRPVIRFRVQVVWVILIFTFIACFIIYMTGANITGGESTPTKFGLSASSDSEESENGSSIENTENKKPQSNEIINPVPASEMLSETYFGKCMFVGDSISVGLSDYQLVPIKSVCATVGMNIEKINKDKMKTGYGNMTALNTLKKAKPDNIYIMLGSNGIAWLTNDEMIGLYSQFVDNIKKELPNSKIYLLSIPPVTSEREKKADSPVLNSDIDKYNSELLKMANKKKIYYVDINTALKGNDGKFPKENAAEDGMHFKKNTYNIMLEYILSHTAS